MSMIVTPIGADKVLIQAVDGENLKELLNDAQSILQNWFSEIYPWSPREVAKERFAWVRCKGVAIHA